MNALLVMRSGRNLQDQFRKVAREGGRGETEREERRRGNGKGSIYVRTYVRHTYYSLLFAVVVIGFEQELYSVGESDGQVNIAVAVMNGQLQRPVMVTLVTMEGSALGKL